MKNGIKFALCVSLFFLGVLGGYFGFKYYDGNKKEESVQEKDKVSDVVQEEEEKDKVNDVEQEEDLQLTLEKIISLANQDTLNLKQEYHPETVLQLDNKSRSLDLELKLDNGLLKIIGDNKEWKVNDLDEKVIAIEQELLYGCDITVISSLFLTEKGNLYRLYRDERNSTMYEKKVDDVVVKDSFFKQLDTNTEITLGLVKLNRSEKVKAISTLKRCQQGVSCGGCETVVYMANGEYRYVSEGLAEKYAQE